MAYHLELRSKQNQLIPEHLQGTPHKDVFLHCSETLAREFFSIFSIVVHSEENTSGRYVHHVPKRHALHVLRTHMLKKIRPLSELSERSEVLGFHYLQSRELAGIEKRHTYLKCVDPIA
jgi:hypothetical protein